MQNAEEFQSIEGRLAREVEWGDCDGAGIIFYPTYFRWMDAATWAFMRSVGYDPQRMRAERLSMPLVSAECQFLIAAKHGDKCEVRSRIRRFGSSSFVVGHEVVRSDAAVMAKGAEKRVWARHQAGAGSQLKGEVIPDALRALFKETHERR